MNQKNLEYLKEGLKYLGFGDRLNQELENNIKQQPEKFQLTLVGEFTRGQGKDKMEYKLDFDKSQQTDMYFLNRYHATLKNDDPEKERRQTFYITKNTGITAKEGYNLLSGRAVNKDLVTQDNKPYNAWLQLDFTVKDRNDNYSVKQYHSGYGYELDKVLQKHLIKELSNPDDRNKLLRSLEKGNLQQVTFVKEGKEEKMFIEANPRFKNIDVYNSNFQKVFQGIEKKEKVESGQFQQAEDSKKKLNPDVTEEGPDKGKRSYRKKGMSV